MAVFVSGSDETAGKTHRDTFLQSGFLGPEEDWSRFFAPAWQERVLDGPPPIPYLHMTEIRSEEWRNAHGISKQEADNRIDEAFALIDAMGTFVPFGAELNAGIFRDRFATAKVVVSSGGAKSLEPDYICFLGHVFLVLTYVDTFHPEAEKVDFIVEHKAEATKHIQEFHSNIATNLDALGVPSLSRLVGELIPGGKDRVPLQAADVLCWHSARYATGIMDAADERRYGKIAHRLGSRLRISSDQISEMATALGV